MDFENSAEREPMRCKLTNKSLPDLPEIHDVLG